MLSRSEQDIIDMTLDPTSDSGVSDSNASESSSDVGSSDSEYELSQSSASNDYSDNDSLCPTPSTDDHANTEDEYSDIISDDNEIPNIRASNSVDPDTHRLCGSDGASQSFVNINAREHNGSRNLRAVNTIRQNEASSSTDSSDDSDLWEPVFPPPKRRRTSAFILSSNYTEIEPPIHDSP